MSRNVLIGVVVALGLVLLMGGCSVMGRYNAIVTENETVDAAWAQVQNVLQRRADLIPNLVETVKGYASHEREVFENVAEARSRLAGATTPEEAARANAGLTSALGRLLAIVENYPELKANQNFQQLQDELAGTENRIATERMRYNEVVRAFNTRIKRFPDRLIAGLFGFAEREYFEASGEAQQVPRVSFGG
jgi:LemA protein